MTGHNRSIGTPNSLADGSHMTGHIWDLNLLYDRPVIYGAMRMAKKMSKRMRMAMECHGAGSTALPTCAHTHDLRVVDNYAWFCGAFWCAITHSHVVAELVWIWIQILNLEQNMTSHIIAPSRNWDSAETTATFSVPILETISIFGNWYYFYLLRVKLFYFWKLLLFLTLRVKLWPVICMATIIMTGHISFCRGEQFAPKLWPVIVWYDRS